MNLFDLLLIGLLVVALGFNVHTEIVLRRTKRMQDDYLRKLAQR